MTLEEKMNSMYKQGKLEGIQEGDFKRAFLSVRSLVDKGVVKTEEEACEILSYDPQEYRISKERFSSVQ